MTGPEYAHLALEQVVERDIDVLTNTYVTDVSRDLRAKLMSPQAGISTVDTGSLVIATGARERTRAAIKIPGQRPAGVMTAGLAQKMVNLHGYLPGRRAVILGSGS
ncbi:MAG: pyridine nucleotide-disulfide oxidoreductase, partial [Alphaproteobacteria bacterium]|nr:pyridine nucleotide-disulfide oxidoreductase [Alphaproteobacteria bacterium]